MRKDHQSTTKESLLDPKSALLVSKSFEEDTVICSSKPLIYSRNLNDVSQHKTKSPTSGLTPNLRRPTAHGIGKNRHRNKNRKRGQKSDQEIGWILGA